MPKLFLSAVGILFKCFQWFFVKIDKSYIIFITYLRGLAGPKIAWFPCGGLAGGTFIRLPGLSHPLNPKLSNIFSKIYGKLLLIKLSKILSSFLSNVRHEVNKKFNWRNFTIFLSFTSCPHNFSLKTWDRPTLPVRGKISGYFHGYLFPFSFCISSLKFCLDF